VGINKETHLGHDVAKYVETGRGKIVIKQPQKFAEKLWNKDRELLNLLD